MAKKVVKPFSDENFLDGYEPITPDLSAKEPPPERSEDNDNDSGHFKIGGGDYSQRFLSQPRGVFPKKIYICVEFHEIIETIVKILGKGDVNLTLSGFLHNILSEHFEKYGDEIDRLLLERFESKRPLGKSKR